MRDDGFARQVISAWALGAAAFADVLAEQDPAWRSEARELAGGRLVLSGAGLYVNVAIGVGIDDPLTDADVDVIVARSEAVGVTPAVEVTPHTHPGTLDRLASRGFVHENGQGATVLVRDTGPPSVAHPDDVLVTPVRTPGQLAEWQEVSALGWGHDTPKSRRAADVFALAAHAIDGEGMVIAHDAGDRRPLGCASLTMLHGVATLGGMSTIPAERGRGVQAALIRHRLDVARRGGFEAATSRAVTGGASERNLIRHGFEPLFVIETFRRAATTG